MKKGLWKDEEVKDLFQYVEQVKNSNKPLKTAFALHAKKYGRRPNSVRNYYYHEVDNLSEDAKRADKLKIDIKNHEKTEINYFSSEEEGALMQKIQKLVKEGNSVRKACMILSNGDIGQMLRYQNKYRNFVSKNSEEGKIIKFTAKKKETLTDGDINSLFAGLVRLVKRSAMEEVNDKFKEERANANSMLRKVLVDLNRKEREINSLKEDLLRLKAENARLIENAVKKKCSQAEALSKKIRESE